MPDFRGLFLRGTGGNAAPLGVQQGDAIRNITGSFGLALAATDWSKGALIRSGGGKVVRGSHDGNVSGGTIALDASQAVPTADENRPMNKAVRYLVRALP